ncbi:MAG: transposase [Reichenbachiella sp.]
MSAYKFNDPEGMYFVTFTVVEWLDVFTRDDYRQIVLKSLRHCQQEKGLIIHAWVVMSNHMHLIISRKLEGEQLSGIVRDFKKYTSKSIIKSIEENNLESRRNWLLWIFKSAGAKNNNNTNYQFWRQDNHAEQLVSNKFMDQKLNYIHMNPVVSRLVEEPEHYLYSSARDYTGLKGLLQIENIE